MAFDWRSAIVICADEVMCCLLAAEACKADPAAVDRELRTAQAHADHAAWLARGYGYRHRLRRKRLPTPGVH